MKIKLSQKQWKLIGKKAGWAPRDPSDISDADLGPIYTADEEEDILLGPEENLSDEDRLKEAYRDGYEIGLTDDSTIRMPYRQDTETGSALSKEWFKGWKDAQAKASEKEEPMCDMCGSPTHHTEECIYFTNNLHGHNPNW
jgi:ribosome modulation factor